MSWISFWHALPISSDWMRWNLFLAWIPLGLSIGLFRFANPRSLLWWAGILIFIAFLPNAPYILTDVIHLVADIQQTESLLINTLIIIPKYVLFIMLGFGAYVLSLVNISLYLKKQSRSQWVGPIELTLHGLSAIGIYLGRFDRLNSWTIVTHPEQVLLSLIRTITTERSLLLILVMTVTIAAFYWIAKQIVLALMLRYQTSKDSYPMIH